VAKLRLIMAMLRTKNQLFIITFSIMLYIKTAEKLLEIETSCEQYLIDLMRDNPLEKHRYILSI